MVNAKRKLPISHTHPELLLEWDARNEISPDEVTYGSSKKVWWKCLVCHYSYDSRVYNRTKGRGCRYCAGKKASKENNLESLCQSLLKEWDFERNSISPADITIKSKKAVYWVCVKDHSWKTRVYNRTIRKTGCPTCAGQRAIARNNTFEKHNPELLAEWNSKEISPSQVSPYSHKKIIWTCKNCKYEWIATAAARSQGSGCPKCANVKRREYLKNR